MSTFNVVSHGAKFDFDSASWSSEFQEYLMGYALKVILDRSSSQQTKTSGATDAERLETCKKTAERLAKGEMPSRGGFGKSRLSDEDFALRQALNSLLKANKGETLEAQLKRYTEALAKKQGKSFEDAMLAKVRAKLQTLDVYKKALAARKAKPVNDLDDLDL